jgi:hypothetical protein
MKISYEVSKDLEKIYVNGVWESLKCYYQIILTELTMQDRITLGWKTHDVEGLELTGDALTKEIISASKQIPASENEELIKKTIKEKIERRIDDIKKRAGTSSSGKLCLKADDTFKDVSIVK